MSKFTLLAIFLAIKTIYLPLNKRKSKYYWKSKMDDMIPLVPVFVIPYIGYFFLVIASVFFLWNSFYVAAFLKSYITSYVLAGLFWYLVPNGVARPVIHSRDIFSRLTKFIYKNDDDTNGFPSAHVFSTLICCYFLLLVYQEKSVLIWSSASLIIVSTLLTKQHYLIDVVGGVIVFALSLLIGTNLW
ncbi:MAG: phosphatase PAP2 family protein [Patescibacteria group bacterium]